MALHTAALLQWIWWECRQIENRYIYVQSIQIWCYCITKSYSTTTLLLHSMYIENRYIDMVLLHNKKLLLSDIQHNKKTSGSSNYYYTITFRWTLKQHIIVSTHSDSSLLFPHCIDTHYVMTGLGCKFEQIEQKAGCYKNRLLSPIELETMACPLVFVP